MRRVTIKLDSAGIGRLLKSPEMRRMVDGATGRIAGQVRPQVGGAEVRADSYATDRAAGAVVIADKRGMAYQAEGGVLTRAAASIGAEVRTRR